MDRVDALLNRGFNLIKDSLIAFCREISPDKGLDFAPLEKTLVEFKPHWGCFMEKICIAAELMSYEEQWELCKQLLHLHYQVWSCNSYSCSVFFCTASEMQGLA